MDLESALDIVLSGCYTFCKAYFPFCGRGILYVRRENYEE